MRVSGALRVVRDPSFGVTGDMPRAPARMGAAGLAPRLLALDRCCRGNAGKRAQRCGERGAQSATDDGTGAHTDPDPGGRMSVRYWIGLVRAFLTQMTELHDFWVGGCGLSGALVRFGRRCTSNLLGTARSDEHERGAGGAGGCPDG